MQRNLERPGVSTWEGNRVPSLDGLRGVSILLVIVGHSAGTQGFPHLLDGLHHLGNWGVKLFFLISGFIITKILLDEMDRTERVNLTSFYVRRVAKLMPAYFFYVACIVAAAAAGIVDLLPGDVFHAITFTMNYHYDRSWYLNHTWSLAVEQQFYLTWPFLLLVLGRARMKDVCIGIVLFAILFRMMQQLWWGSPPSALTRALPAAADALAIGALLAIAHQSAEGQALLKRFVRRDQSIVFLALAFVAPSACYLLSRDAFYIVGQTLMIVFLAGFLYSCVRHPEGFCGRIINHRFFTFHGLVSYSLYLWQEPFLNVTVESWPTAFPLNLMLAYAAGVCSYFLLEEPARKAIVQRYKNAAWRVA